jgi:subtilase family serine protease
MSELRRKSRSPFRAKVSPRRTFMNHPRLEELETRTLLSTTLLSSTSAQLFSTHPSVVIAPPFVPGEFPLTPNEMRDAYGVNLVQFSTSGGNVAGNGAGQTIAIVDAFNDPDIVADLSTFDSTFGLPNPPNIYVLNQNGGLIANQTGTPVTPPNGPTSGNNTWSVEESLDVDWSHSIAPGANIVVFEATSNSNANLATAVASAGKASVYTALGIPAASVISNSYGSDDSARAASSDEAEDKSTYAPISNANQVSLVFSSGDSGVAEFPSTSPYVLGVGGTEVSLKVTPFGTTWSSETTYDDVDYSGVDYGSSGGGTSAFETEPSYQLNYGISNASGHREAPDVSMSGGLQSGVYITDSYEYPGYSALGTVFGTSLAAPMWAGLVAITNQGRELANGGTPDPIGNVQEAVYAMPTSDFHDITTGTNGLTGGNLHSAGPGYDEVTGIGSPIANKLIPGLVAYTGTGAVTFVESDIDADAAAGIDPNATDNTNGGRLIEPEAVFSTADVNSVESALAQSNESVRTLTSSPITVAMPPSGQVERMDATVEVTALPIPATTYVEGFRGASTDALAGTPSDAVPVDFNLPAENAVVETSNQVFTPAAVLTPAVQDLGTPVSALKTVSVSDAVFADSNSIQALDTRAAIPAAVIAGDETHTVDLAMLAGMALALGGSWSALAQAEETRKYPALRS